MYKAGKSEKMAALPRGVKTPKQQLLRGVQYIRSPLVSGEKITTVIL